MFLNLAAAWKDLASAIEPSMTEENLAVMQLGFYCGAHATHLVMATIAEKHEKKAATILLRALQKEAQGFAAETKRKAKRKAKA